MCPKTFAAHAEHADLTGIRSSQHAVIIFLQREGLRPKGFLESQTRAYGAE
jgi:hypothetical protein